MQSKRFSGPLASFFPFWGKNVPTRQRQRIDDDLGGRISSTISENAGNRPHGYQENSRPA